MPDSSAADIGTDQLSSPTGINSTPAHMTAMASSRPAMPIVPIPNGSMAPKLVNQKSKPYEPTKDPATNAADPAIDLSLLKKHLFDEPNRRPIKSARPSPAAIVARDTTPTGESVQKKNVAKRNTTTYIKGPPSTSLASPDREMAPARSDSDPIDADHSPTPPPEVPATISLSALRRRTTLANILAPYAFEYRGHGLYSSGHFRPLMLPPPLLCC